MKKIFKYSILGLSTFCAFNSLVFAKNISAKDIPNSTYVIGNHMFDRNVSEGYNGKLTTTNIMYSSQTIDSFDMNDMIIYYKNSRGKWVNALNGESVKPKDNYNIEFKNFEVIEPIKPIVVVDKPSNYISDGNKVKFKFFVLLDNYNDKAKTPDGVELTIANSNMGSSYGSIVIDMPYDEFNQGLSYIDSRLEVNTDIMPNHKYNQLVTKDFIDLSINIPYVVYAKSYNLDKSGKKVYGEVSKTKKVIESPKPELEIKTLDGNYIAKDNGYYKYSIGLKKDPFYDMIYKNYPDEFRFILCDETNNNIQIGTYKLTDTINLSVEENTLKKYHALIVYKDKNGDFVKIFNDEKNAISLTIDTRELTKPVWKDPHFDSNSELAYININSDFYKNQPKNSLNYNRMGTEIYSIDEYGDYNLVAKDDSYHAINNNGFAFYVSRVYAKDASGKIRYSAFSDRMPVVLYPIIKADPVQNGKVTISVANAKDFNENIKIKLYQKSSVVSEKDKLIGTYSVNNPITINVDSNIEVYAIAEKFLNSGTYYSSKSNTISLTK